MVDVRLWDAAFTGERALRIVVEGRATAAATEQIGNGSQAEDKNPEDQGHRHTPSCFGSRQERRFLDYELPGEPCDEVAVQQAMKEVFAGFGATRQAAGVVRA